jgi:hypothetical protein
MKFITVFAFLLQLYKFKSKITFIFPRKINLFSPTQIPAKQVLYNIFVVVFFLFLYVSNNYVFIVINGE